MTTPVPNVMLGRPSRAGKLLDRLGVGGSMLCAVHCAVVPLLLALVPAFGAGLDSPAFDLGFILFATALGLASLVAGYRHHGDRRALYLLTAGCGLLWSAALLSGTGTDGMLHTVMMVTGGLLLASAHGVNLRLTARRCSTCV